MDKTDVYQPEKNIKHSPVALSPAGLPISESKKEEYKKLCNILTKLGVAITRITPAAWTAHFIDFQIDYNDKPKLKKHDGTFICNVAPDGWAQIARTLVNNPIHTYHRYLVAFSGGKDSTACFLHLLDHGIPKNTIELWHHDVDGNEAENFIDWPITTDYCRKFAQAFGVPIYFSWRVGGFKRELMRNNQRTAPVDFETPQGLSRTGGIKGKLSTRLKFPQVSADLQTRWCSAALKIDVMTAAIRNQERFLGIRTLVLSGERGEESPARAKYNIMEPDRSDLRNGKKYQRHVDRFRPIRDYTERMVWESIRHYKVHAHPCYYLGFSRCSCVNCIFSNCNQARSAQTLLKKQTNNIASLEDKLGYTIKRKGTWADLMKKGTAYPSTTNKIYADVAISKHYTLPIFISDENWQIPAGAFGESAGPT